jgi:hypothetical protein
MSFRRRLAVVLSLSMFALAVLPELSVAAGHRGPSRMVREEGVFSLATDWVVRAWGALTGVTPSPYGHLSGASGPGYDPLGCGPTPCSNATTPPPPTGDDL